MSLKRFINGFNKSNTASNGGSISLTQTSSDSFNITRTTHVPNTFGHVDTYNASTSRVDSNSQRSFNASVGTIIETELPRRK